MLYTILIYESAADTARREEPTYRASYLAYGKALREAGILRGGAGLQLPETATTVRLAGGKRVVQDGPYADTKEKMGGFYVIEVDDLDKALEWAARCPAVAGEGVVEVRPHLAPFAPG